MSDAPLLVRENVPLAPLTTLRVGGAARGYLRAAALDVLPHAHEWAAHRAVPIFVLGGGSNLVIADDGWKGLVIHMVGEGIQFSSAGADTRVTAQAGEPWDRLVAATVARGLGGLECLSGIPGTTGGTPVQNVGAYGQEVSTTIERLTAFDRISGTIVEIDGTECQFHYRGSRFKEQDTERFVIGDVTFRLRPQAPTIVYPDLAGHFQRERTSSPGLPEVREAVLAIRRRKGMVVNPEDPDTRSVGSFFVNPVVDAVVRDQLAQTTGESPPAFARGPDKMKIPAAWLIERAGFEKGFTAGPVGLSTKHPLALINRGGASARDVVALAARIKRAVLARFGVALRPEPVFVGFDNDPAVEFLFDRGDDSGL